MAKERKEWEAKLRKLQVDKMVLEYKINGLEKMSEQRKRITWLRMRTKIVEFARTISDHMNLEKKLQEYNRTIEQRRKDLDMITTEVPATGDHSRISKIFNFLWRNTFLS